MGGWCGQSFSTAVSVNGQTNEWVTSPVRLFWAHLKSVFPLSGCHPLGRIWHHRILTFHKNVVWKKPLLSWRRAGGRNVNVLVMETVLLKEQICFFYFKSTYFLYFILVVCWWWWSPNDLTQDNALWTNGNLHQQKAKTFHFFWWNIKF